MKNKATKLLVDKLARRIEKAQRLYALGRSPLTDEEFDRKVERLRKLAPDHPFFKVVGARVPVEKRKVKLPVPMGSLEKLRPQEIKLWAKSLPEKYRGDFAVMPKIDGMSLLIEYAPNGELVRVMTRGDGITGQDATEALRANLTIPKRTSTRDRKMYVRGELVLSKDDFALMRRAAAEENAKNKNKKQREYQNPRNMLVGCVNAKEHTLVQYETLKRAKFLAFNVDFEPHSKDRPAPEIHGYNDPKAHVRADKAPKTVIIKFLQKAGFTTVEPGIAKFADRKVWKGNARKSIKDLMTSHPYDIDGLVISVNSENPRALGYESNGLNPKWERAIKLDVADQHSQTIEVGKILWSVTPRGVVKPVVRLKYPATFNGVRVRNVFVDNAGFVKKHGIGEGAIVTVIRSGDVIPRLVRVDTPAPTENNYPRKCKKHGVKLQWTPTKTDLFCPVCAGNLNSPADFFKQLGMENFGKTLVQKAADALKVESIGDLLANMHHLKKYEGFGEKRTTQFEVAVKKALAEASLAKLMHATGAFRSVTLGLGEARIQAILDQIGPELFSARLKQKEIAFKAQQAEGIGKLAADCFAEQLHHYLVFYAGVSAWCTRATKEMQGVKPKGMLKGKRYAFTGFRDKSIENFIKDEGGTITGTINEKLTALFAPDKNGMSVKLKKARDLGVEIINRDSAMPWLLMTKQRAGNLDPFKRKKRDVIKEQNLLKIKRRKAFNENLKKNDLFVKGGDSATTIMIKAKRLAEIAAIKDEDIDTSDIPEVTEAFFKRAKLRKPLFGGRGKKNKSEDRPARGNR